MDDKGTKIMKLGGREFRCVDVLPLGLVFDLAEAMDAEAGGFAAIAAMSKLTRTLVVPDERKELKKFLDSVENPISFDDLNEALGEVLKQFGADRPTARSSRSSPSGGASGPGSKVVSLSRGTVKTDDQSRKDGASAAS